ncbi:hypothetical protein [Acetobacter oeni]|uniref:Uncharacterized protein n=1 Tax=Acetobacter oeni TaxID=304077 RepID=A0A511XKZ9_9PROT|nr:hypothetical protein [Acetobacter oeni]MBB3883228.1 hypothetical protein [Acetobacter oeni]NHO19294.1 hypothetical protein [Acetobacter oeni]GBR07248.1 hypothetical protein AA21952_2289 [Acetobacter oeni LMG 21952]GEN63623.1 hypothetical protein AOE01nite_18470 [Acetobacter oeni]
MVTTTNDTLTTLVLNGSSSTTLQSGYQYIVLNTGAGAANVSAYNNDSLYVIGQTDVTLNGYDTTVSYASGSDGSTINISGYDNTVTNFDGTVNAGNAIFNTFVDSTGTFTTGAYTSYVDSSGTIDSGAKSQFSNCTGTVTTGSDSVFNVFKDGTINSGIKTIASEIDDSNVTVGRNSTIATLNSDTLTTTGTGVTVGALDNSEVNYTTDSSGSFTSGGWGNFSVTGSIQGTDYIQGQTVSISFGTMDQSAVLHLDTFGNGSTVQGGTGNQSVDQTGTGSMTFISANSNSDGVFTATGGTGKDTFEAVSSMTMTGGTGGANTFDIIKSAAGATDVIKDFTAAASNKLELSGFGLTQSSFATILDNATVSSAGLTLAISSNTSVTLAGVTDKADLTSANVSLS